MTIQDIYNISQAIYASEQKQAQVDASDIISGYPDLLDIYESLTSAQLKELEEFVQRNIDLYEEYPTQHQSEEDMIQRKRVINEIEEKLRKELTSINF